MLTICHGFQQLYQAKIHIVAALKQEVICSHVLKRKRTGKNDQSRAESWSGRPHPYISAKYNFANNQHRDHHAPEC